MISIAMTTYNGERYLREQLDSILGQTIRDFELYVCDDNSTDSTWMILQEYQKKDNRLFLFRNEQNLGFKKNFEKAIGYCKGEYVALSDQDDEWMPDHLEKLLSIIGDNMLACGNSDLIDEKGNKIGLTLAEMESLDVFPENPIDLAYTITYFRSAFQGASMLIKRDFLPYALPIPEGANYHDSWFSLLSCFLGGMAYTFDIVNQYRMHSSNVTGHRVVRKSKFKDFKEQILFSGRAYDRKFLIEGVRERIPNLSSEELEFINSSLERIHNSDSLYGRITNIPFRIKNYYKIYSCKR